MGFQQHTVSSSSHKHTHVFGTSKFHLATVTDCHIQYTHIRIFRAFIFPVRLHMAFLFSLLSAHVSQIRSFFFFLLLFVLPFVHSLWVNGFIFEFKQTWTEKTNLAHTPENISLLACDIETKRLRICHVGRWVRVCIYLYMLEHFHHFSFSFTF